MKKGDKAWKALTEDEQKYSWEKDEVKLRVPIVGSLLALFGVVFTIYSCAIWDRQSTWLIWQLLVLSALVSVKSFGLIGEKYVEFKERRVYYFTIRENPTPPASIGSLLLESSSGSRHVNRWFKLNDNSKELAVEELKEIREKLWHKELQLATL